MGGLQTSRLRADEGSTKPQGGTHLSRTGFIVRCNGTAGLFRGRHFVQRVGLEEERPTWCFRKEPPPLFGGYKGIRKKRNHLPLSEETIVPIGGCKENTYIYI